VVALRYRPRIVDAELKRRLASTGAIVIEGPRACGKTETARQAARSEVRLDVDSEAVQAAQIDPAILLAGPTPRLIDEWQVAPEIWNHVRRAVDDRAGHGHFILTGSAVPADDATRHTGAMRFGRIQMRPMSLYESGESDGSVSLVALMDGGRVAVPDRGLELKDVVASLCRGGWPGLLDLPIPDAVERVQDYVDEICRTDIPLLGGTRHNPQRVRRLIQSLARNVATHATLATLSADTGGDGGPVERHTLGEYLDVLERIFVVEDQPPWAPHLRSRYVLRRASKRHFVDPSLAVAGMRTSPDRLLTDLNYLGFLFESMVVRDVRVYAQSLGGRVAQFRDSSDLEIDIVVENNAGDWGAFEVKLGGSALIDAGAKNLLAFAERIDGERTRKPAFLGVIVATGYGYTRPDSVHVIPIGSLGP
jgi:uncharacterized protein